MKELRVRTRRGLVRMTFIHAYLLGGLLLAGIPVLLHLLQRQKPRRLPFPAFRFLRARQRTNQRKLRLQNLLLLALRVLVIAALCLALARPRIFSHRLSLQSDRPVAAVLLLDTSSSMGYTVGGQTRLEEALRRARELLDEMSPASRVAILDAGDGLGDNYLPHADALARLDTLRLRPACAPVNRSLERAYQLLRDSGQGEDPPPRFFFIFSDRTRASWESSGVAGPVLPEGVQVLYVDVGVESPRDLAIEKVEIDPPVVAPGGRVEVLVSVRGTAGEQESQLTVSIEGDPEGDRAAPPRLVKFTGAAPASTILSFERTAPRLPPEREYLADLPVQVTAKLATRDALPFNDTRHATFLLRAGRRCLVVVEEQARQRVLQRREIPPWKAWTASLLSLNYRCDVKTPDEVAALPAADLAAYKVVTLFQMRQLPDALWTKLLNHVREGAGLAVVPAGEELADPAAFSHAGAALLPAPLMELASAPAGKPIAWAPFRGEHPLMAPFQRWAQSADPDFARPERRPFVRRYWKTGPPVKEALAISPYDNGSPALLERPVGKGRVILFTTPLDSRVFGPDELTWHNYWPPYSSFGLVLADRVCRHLAGDADTPEVNVLCGQVPQVSPPLAARTPLSVQGPGLAAAERNLPATREARGLGVPQAQEPGNYLVLDADNRVVAGFSLDVKAEESDLERVRAEEIEGVLGLGTLLAVGRSVSLTDEFQASRPPPVELLPALMLALLLILTVESVLANRVARKRTASTPDEPLPRRTGSVAQDL